MHRIVLCAKIIGKSFSFCLLLVAAQSCMQMEKLKVRNSFRQSMLKPQKMGKHLIGFSLYDPEAQRTIFAYQEKKYFTPASNTKLLTFFLATQVLGDSIPSFHYQLRADTLYLQPTGDPSWWDSRFPQHQATNWLRKQAQPISLDFSHDELQVWPPGWTWEDYGYAYAAERSALPFWGNLAQFKLLTPDSVYRVPRQVSVSLDTLNLSNSVRRSRSENLYTIPQKLMGSGWDLQLPFVTSHSLSQQILQDSLSQWVDLADQASLLPYERTFYGISSDSLYYYLLQESDNFLAEQLLVICAAERLGKLNSDRMIRYALDSVLHFLPDRPRWVDGSGLSRYNLLSPRDAVVILDRLQRDQGYETMFFLLPAGGKSGTLEKWYVADEGEKPYVYAKTGTLSNNHNLSGYLITDSGRTLIFSLMQNHYMLSSSEIKKQTEIFLREIKRKF
jgi:D-alanyl-D-alanine carboxypeptidase/D-alanyl-D-alanine-endopeptidase (penicillin-binding protein 4)